MGKDKGYNRIRWWGRSQVVRRRESLVLYKSFNILWSVQSFPAQFAPQCLLNSVPNMEPTPKKTFPVFLIVSLVYAPTNQPKCTGRIKPNQRHNQVRESGTHNHNIFFLIQLAIYPVGNKVHLICIEPWKKEYVEENPGSIPTTSILHPQRILRWV